MADFVLVHGAWHGAWCWQRILPGLWQAGHRAWALDLTGLGARSHLLQAGIGLQQHADDVLALLQAEELEQVILVGHSYGGMVITAAAMRQPQAVAQLVYLDAVVPRPGEAWSSTHAPEVQASRREQIARTGVLAPPDPEVFGLSGADRDWVARRQVPHPGQPYDDALHFDPAVLAALPRTFIDFNDPALATINVSRDRVRQEPGWQIEEIATGHDGMISAADATLAALLRSAKRQAASGFARPQHSRLNF